MISGSFQIKYVGKTYLLILLFLFASLIPITSVMSSDKQWYLISVSAENSWNGIDVKDDIIIAVIDSGVDFSHIDLSSSFWTNIGEVSDNSIDDDGNGYIDDTNGYDFRDDDGDPSPGHEHGTMISGLISASGGPSGINGVAPGMKIMAIRFLKDNLSFDEDDWLTLIKAINYAIDNGAKIINLSMQFLRFPLVESTEYKLNQTIKSAYEKGVVIVSVVGNDPPGPGNEISFPGLYQEVIAVSSVNETNGHPSSSNYGEGNEICAPGMNILTTAPNDQYKNGSGTSFAAPMVSATVGLMLSKNPQLSIEDIREILHNSTIDLGDSGWDPYYGYGLLNVSASIQNTPLPTNYTSTASINNSTETSEKTNQTSGLTIVGYFAFSFIVITIIRKKKLF